MFISVRRTYCGSTIDTTKFNVFVSGLEFEDSYNSATVYQAGDVVTYGGYNYVAVQQSTGQTHTTTQLIGKSYQLKFK